MFKRHCIIILLMLFLAGTGLSQEASPSITWTPFVSVGYGQLPSSDVVNYYDELVQSYRDQGIPIPTQSEFGKTLTANAGLFLRPRSRVSAGISFGYLYTPAYSSYGDNSGTLKVNGSLKTFEILLVFESPLTTLWGFPLLLRVESGFTHASAAIVQDLKYTAQPQYNFSSTWTASGSGLPFRISLGTAMPLGIFTASVHCGYEISSIAVTEAKILSTGGNTEDFDEINLGREGFAFVLGIGMPL